VTKLRNGANSLVVTEDHNLIAIVDDLVVGDDGHAGGSDLGSTAMPAHDVTMNLSHPITVKNVDVEFEIRSDGELMGKVQISKGGIDWTPFKSHARAATWEQFAAWMEGTA
jgi:hypothetical protein